MATKPKKRPTPNEIVLAHADEPGIWRLAPIAFSQLADAERVEYDVNDAGYRTNVWKVAHDLWLLAYKPKSSR